MDGKRYEAEPLRNDIHDDTISPEDVALRRDETIKRMIATPPKKHKNEHHRRRKHQPNPGKRGA